MKLDLIGIGPHRCDPPCVLMQMEEHAKSRRRMTKAELIADAEAGDEAWLNLSAELDMARAYIEQLETQ